MKGNDGTPLTKISGVIIPADWDQDGKVIGVAISTYDEDEYRVEEQVRGQELLQHVRKGVEVVGWAGVEKGKKKITVKSYRLRRYPLGQGR